MHLFYCPDISGKNYLMNEEEARHCIKVLRLKQGDMVYLTDGFGNMHQASIMEINNKICDLTIIQTTPEFQKRDYYLHMAIAPTKNTDRLEWFLEKATEIGIDEITPITCQRSERNILKTDRLNKIITSAVKQSIKAYHPKLNELTKLQDFIQSPFEGHKLIAHCIDSEKKSIKELIKPKENVLILIGPEGDFTLNELNQCMEFNFLPLSLGNSRLRTETAALMACASISFVNS